MNIAISPGFFIHSFIQVVIIEYLLCVKQFYGLGTHYRMTHTLARAYVPGDGRADDKSSKHSKMILVQGCEVLWKKQVDSKIGETHSWKLKTRYFNTVVVVGIIFHFLPRPGRVTFVQFPWKPGMSVMAGEASLFVPSG